MSERKEYTPTMEVLHDIYCGIYAPINPDVKRSSEQFNRAIAAHDQALREQIAQDIEATETLLLHVEDFDKHRESIQGQINGIRAAARIARGKDQTDE